MKKAVCVSLLCMFIGFNAFAQESAYPNVSEEYADTLGILQTETEEAQEEMRSKLSTLWIAVTLNMITADVLQLYIPEGMEEWEDFANGNEANLMLFGAILYQIPISMVYLSKVLPYEENRRANIIAAGFMTFSIITGGEVDPSYWVCASAEILSMALIAWNAWNWPNPEDNQAEQNFERNLNFEKALENIVRNITRLAFSQDPEEKSDFIEHLIMDLKLITN